MTSLSMLYFQKQIFVRKPISPALVIKHIFAKLEQGDAHCDADFQPCWPRCRIIKQIYLCLKIIKTLFICLSIWRPSWFGGWWELLKMCLFVCKCTPPPCCDLLLLSCTCARACRARVSRAETLHKQTFWVGNGLAAGTNWCRVTNVNVNKNTNMNTTLKYGQCLKGVTD